MRNFKIKSQNHVCPVCGKYTFPKYGDFGICRICKWQNDSYCEENPDLDNGPNEYSLNEYRRRWQEKNNKVSESKYSYKSNKG